MTGKSRSETAILVVEDDALLRKSVARFIGQRGYRVFEAENGYEALKIFRRENPSLVLTDIRMPVMNGLDLLDELTGESPRTPVIIFSGATSESDVREALGMGAVDYIAKPIKNVDFLMDKIEKALVHSQVERDPGEDVEKEDAPARKSSLDEEFRKRKRLEKQIARAKLEWERTADAIAEPIALQDKMHYFTRVNKSMAGLFGKTPQAIVGTRKYLSTAGFDNREQAEKDFEALLAGRKVSGRFVDTASGAPYEVNITPYYDRDDTTVIGCVYIARKQQGA
ncbi:MAG: hypothetical protein Kow0089_23760 [Desulfobulbaceae bacterium]